MSIEHCQLCGKIHDNDCGYAPLNILNGFMACNDCIDESKIETMYHFRSHVPGCCEGAPYRYITSNNQKDFLEKLQKNCDKKYQLATSKSDQSILLEVNEKSHWVSGYTNINLKELYNLPFWEDIDKS